MRSISLIDEDIRRLRKLVSLQEDIDTRFTADKNKLDEFGELPGCIQRIGDYTVHKIRLTITQPPREGKKGCRLWILVNKKKEVYIQCLAYAVEEEPSYPSKVCFKIINTRLPESKNPNRQKARIAILC